MSFSAHSRLSPLTGFTKKPEPEGPLVIPALKDRDWRDLARKRKQLYIPPSAAPATGADGSVGGLGTKDSINSGPQLSGLQLKPKRTKEEKGEDEQMADADATAAEAKEAEDAKVKTEAETDDERALRAVLAAAQSTDENGTYNGPIIDIIPTPVTEDDAYKQDVAVLPESASLQDYERVPVSQFGAALLRGMGWKEGEVASRSKRFHGKGQDGKQKGLIEPWVPTARPALLGIGAKEKELLDDGSTKKKFKGRPDKKYIPVVKVERGGISDGTILPRPLTVDLAIGPIRNDSAYARSPNRACSGGLSQPLNQLHPDSKPNGRVQNVDLTKPPSAQELWRQEHSISPKQYRGWFQLSVEEKRPYREAAKAARAELVKSIVEASDRVESKKALRILNSQLRLKGRQTIKVKPPVKALRPFFLFLSTPHFRDYFYIGGHYVADPDSSSLHADGQIYVERLTPASGVTKQYPLLMIHGSGMTGTNFLNTPDGRMGWADWFLGQGYTVYLMDQPSRGRSPWLQNIDGPQTVFSTELVESMFTATARFDLWPNATLHTQWPGNGSVGDAVFDEFYASMVPLLSTDVESATKNQKALVDLVDKIGPIHLLTHSQSGLFGWSLADARPRHIKSLTALEPGGPPFTGDILTPNETTRLYGLTDIPLHYVPPLPHNSSSALNKDKIIVNDPASDGYICFAQSPPLRVLPHLEDVPVRVVTSEARWHGSPWKRGGG
ncbi:hypothetical protein EUX98_g8264 [Antrodiella citrinella]|uniref:Spp2/MOS2 G-patch domain-containing protein n=1 Tax=Antrodiella citrinella TaxID=2447956 RepID=A0A4V6S1M2_9APHY|nr:hypothetical protein EUX98_g8264 [Antrodiella citrinella]